MWVDPQHPANAGVLRSLCRAGQAVDLIDPDDKAIDPYGRCGSHPEVVERIWDQLGRTLPTDCRCVLCGSPALVQSRSGVVLAVARGTHYYVRLPAGVVAEALASGAQAVVGSTRRGQFDVQQEFGPDWVVGRWLDQEQQWCRDVYDIYNSIA